VRRPLSRPEREDYRLLAPVSIGSGPGAFAAAGPRGLPFDGVRSALHRVTFLSSPKSRGRPAIVNVRGGFVFPSARGLSAAGSIAIGAGTFWRIGAYRRLCQRRRVKIPAAHPVATAGRSDPGGPRAAEGDDHHRALDDAEHDHGVADAGGADHEADEQRTDDASKAFGEEQPAEDRPGIAAAV